MVHQLRAGRVLELPLPGVRRNRRIGVPEPVRVRDEVRDPPPEPRGRVGGAGAHADRDAPAVDRDRPGLVAEGERLLRFGLRFDAGDRARGAGGRPQRAVAVGQPISGACELHAGEGRRRVGESRELPDRAVVLRPDPDEPAPDRRAADLGLHPDRPGDLVRRGVDSTHDAGAAGNDPCLPVALDHVAGVRHVEAVHDAACPRLYSQHARLALRDPDRPRAHRNAAGAPRLCGQRDLVDRAILRVDSEQRRGVGVRDPDRALADREPTGMHPDTEAPCDLVGFRVDLLQRAVAGHRPKEALAEPEQRSTPSRDLAG